MSTRKISELPDAQPIVGDEYIPIVQSGQTRRALASELGSGDSLSRSPVQPLLLGHLHSLGKGSLETVYFLQAAQDGALEIVPSPEIAFAEVGSFALTDSAGGTWLVSLGGDWDHVLETSNAAADFTYPYEQPPYVPVGDGSGFAELSVTTDGELVTRVLRPDYYPDYLPLRPGFQPPVANDRGAIFYSDGELKYQHTAYDDVLQRYETTVYTMLGDGAGESYEFIGDALPVTIDDNAYGKTLVFLHSSSTVDVTLPASGTAVDPGTKFTLLRIGSGDVRVVFPPDVLVYVKNGSMTPSSGADLTIDPAEPITLVKLPEINSDINRWVMLGSFTNPSGGVG